MKIHGLLALLIRAVLHKSRALSLNLHTTARFLLNVLDVGASMANDLCAKVEARERLHINGDAFFRPFTLQQSATCQL